jgi:hypothetical protein
MGDYDNSMPKRKVKEFQYNRRQVIEFIEKLIKQRKGEVLHKSYFIVAFLLGLFSVMAYYIS